MQIYEVPKERRYWFVRADDGFYYDHFIRYGIIALGHIDILDLPESKKSPFIPEFDPIEKKLRKIHEGKDISSRTTSTHLNQVSSFLYDIQVGDWVLTVGADSIRVGRVIGYPRLTKKPLKIVYDVKRDRSVILEYNLRRRVTWGPTILRKKITYGLGQSLRANQTLFNLDKHRDAIYHTLYPAFISDGNLHLSANINTISGVKNYSVAFLFNFLNEMEVLAKEFDNGINKENFDQFFDKYVDNDLLTITTKARFHSSGEIWNIISAIGDSLGSWAVYCIVAYSMLFGNQKLGFDGLIDLQTRQKIWDIIISRMSGNKIISVSENLALKAPSNKTEKIETNENDEKPSKRN